MTHQSGIPRRIGALLFGITLVTAGCTEEPKSEQPVTYERASETLCAQIGLQDILRQRWQLSPPSEGAADPYYDTGPGIWNASCRFVGAAEDGRFATNIEFRASGSVTLTVYEEAPEAELRFSEQAAGEKKRVPSVHPGGSVVEINGWWDSGISVKAITGVDSGKLGFEDLGSTRQARELLVRHDNLVVRSTVEANAPTSDREEAGKLLDEIVSVLVDESVKHLPRTAG